MKQFILHIAVVLVFYIYGIKVSETLLDRKSNVPGTPLDSQIDDSGTVLGKHSHDPDADRNVVRKDIFLNYTGDLNVLSLNIL